MMGVMSIQVITPREVPLGGLRAMTVRRTLPSKGRSFVGAWCFVDHYGPDDVARTGGMDVAPHPHTGLQTVSWLFEGEIEHRDSGGVHGMVRPGEMNLMTAGHGIAHSEVSTAATGVLHGVQLWVALPAGDREAARDFQHYVPELVPLGGELVQGGATGQAAAPEVSGGTVRVFVGTLPGLEGASSPVRTATPLLGAEITLEPGARWEFATEDAYEHAVLVDQGTITLDGQPLTRGELGVRDVGPQTMAITVAEDSEPARLVLLGGEPFDEQIVMWWNFVGRSHEEIVEYRAAWQARSDRFGEVEGYVGEIDWIPAPELPNVRLRPRGRLGRL